MVHTTSAPSTRTLLASAGLGAALIATIAGVAGGLATAADSSSSAYGIRISGTESASADSGSVATASGGISATGISTMSRDGYAEASVASIKIGTTTVGPIHARCENGMSTVSHGDVPTARNLKVIWGTAGSSSVTAATITITGATGDATTITAAHVTCGDSSGGSTATPPTSSPGKPAPPTQSSGPATSPPRTQHRPPLADKPAPAPERKTGHVAVTG